MVRTQIQLPDEVYFRAKRLAEAKEISLAELTRRGLELILGQYPRHDEIQEPWQPPIVRGLGWKSFTHEEIKDVAQQTELEEELEVGAGRHARL